MQTTEVLLIVLAIFPGYCHNSETEDEVENFSQEFLKLARTGEFSPELEAMIDKLAFPKDWYLNPQQTIDGLGTPVSSCSGCKGVARSFIKLKRDGTSEEDILEALTKTCVRLNVQTETVCRGFLALNQPVLSWIVDHDPTVTEDDLCALPLQNANCGPPPARFEWTVEIDQSPPKFIPTKPSKENFKIVHVSDIHYDPLYEPLGNAACGQPNCCKKGQGPSAEGAEPAGYWGDYRSCDTPWHSVVDALTHINTTHSDAELIYYTGDIVDHGGWESTYEGNKQSILDVFDSMKKTFGEIPVVPVVGNHEANPLNIFAPSTIVDERLSTKWLYELLADIWINSGWLPESTRDTIIEGGFYTISPRKGFRIIVLNNNVAYTNNWWLIYEPNDLGGQLKWLGQTLLRAEEAQEFVHILAHVPSGSSDQQNTWSREYRKIVNRFFHIITGQFNGHTHSDEFKIFYDPQDYSNVVSVAWNGGSVTTWVFVNPNYRTCTVNSKTYEVEDLDNWMYDIAEANLTPGKRPNWVKSYSFRDEYSLRDLSKDSIRDLVVRLAKEGPTATTYKRHMSKDAKIDGAPTACDKECALKNACRIVTSVNNNDTDCNYLKGLN